MASKILVSGYGGNIGTQLRLVSPDQSMYLNSKVNFLDEKGPAEFVAYAIETGCRKILHLAWSSNTSSDYLNEEVQRKWTDRTTEMVERACVHELNVYCVGTGQELEHNVDNAYVNAKRILYSRINSELPTDRVTWIRPFYIYSKELRIPRIVRSFLAEPNNFTLNRPLEAHDYVEIRDVASAIYMSLKQNMSGDVEIGSGRLTSNTNLLNSLFNKNISSEYLDSQSFGVVANNERIMRTGWRPLHTYETFNFTWK